MSKGRMEAFSDGVLAVIITIMVLEMKSPRGMTLAALAPVLPFTTAWMGENHFAAWPVAVYGIVLLLAGVSGA